MALGHHQSHEIVCWGESLAPHQPLKAFALQGNPNMLMALAGNKADLADSRAVTKEEATAYAEENSLAFAETSAKTNVNVVEVTLARLETTSLQKLRQAVTHNCLDLWHFTFLTGAARQ